MEKIIPILGLDWLSSCLTLSSSWFQALVEEKTESNVLMDLLRKAAKKIGFPLEEPPKIIIDSSKKNLMCQEEIIKIALPFLNWLTQEIKNQEGKVNVKMPSFLRFPEGLFIATELIEKFVQQDAAIRTLHEFAEKFCYLFLEKGGLLFSRYRSIHFENRHVLTGIILKEEYLDDSIKSYPIQTDFMPDIFL